MIAAKHPDFPSDLMTTFSGAGCSIHIAAAAGKRVVSIVDFAAAAIAGTALKDDEIIQALEVPHTPHGATEIFDSWKIMPRHQNAHAYVSRNDEFWIQNEEFCIKNEGFCIKTRKVA